MVSRLNQKDWYGKKQRSSKFLPSNIFRVQNGIFLHTSALCDVFRMQNGIFLHTTAFCDVFRVHQWLFLHTRASMSCITCAPELLSAHENSH